MFPSTRLLSTTDSKGDIGFHRRKNSPSKIVSRINKTRHHIPMRKIKEEMRVFCIKTIEYTKTSLRYRATYTHPRLERHQSPHRHIRLVTTGGNNA